MFQIEQQDYCPDISNKRLDVAKKKKHHCNSKCVGPHVILNPSTLLSAGGF